MKKQEEAEATKSGNNEQADNHGLSPKQKAMRLKRIRRSAEKMNKKKKRKIFYDQTNHNYNREIQELVEMGITLSDAEKLLTRSYARGSFDELQD